MYLCNLHCLHGSKLQGSTATMLIAGAAFVQALTDFRQECVSQAFCGPHFRAEDYSTQEQVEYVRNIATQTQPHMMQ